MTKDPYLEKLSEAIPPPARPVFGSPDDCRRPALEKGLEAIIPDSLWEFGSLYGSGCFRGDQEACVFNPYDPNFGAAVREMVDVFRFLQKYTPEYYMYRIYPDSGGILPFGNQSGGLGYYWVQSRDTVAFDDLVRRKNGKFKEFRHWSVTHFVYKLLTGSIRGEPSFKGKVSFIPGEYVVSSPSNS